MQVCTDGNVVDHKSIGNPDRRRDDTEAAETQ